MSSGPEEMPPVEEADFKQLVVATYQANLSPTKELSATYNLPTLLRPWADYIPQVVKDDPVDTVAAMSAAALANPKEIVSVLMEIRKTDNPRFQLMQFGVQPMASAGVLRFDLGNGVSAETGGHTTGGKIVGQPLPRPDGWMNNDNSLEPTANHAVAYERRAGIMSAVRDVFVGGLREEADYNKWEEGVWKLLTFKNRATLYRELAATWERLGQPPPADEPLLVEAGPTEPETTHESDNMDDRFEACIDEWTVYKGQTPRELRVYKSQVQTYTGRSDFYEEGPLYDELLSAQESVPEPTQPIEVPKYFAVELAPDLQDCFDQMENWLEEQKCLSDSELLAWRKRMKELAQTIDPQALTAMDDLHRRAVMAYGEIVHDVTLLSGFLDADKNDLQNRSFQHCVQVHIMSFNTFPPMRYDDSRHNQISVWQPGDSYDPDKTTMNPVLKFPTAS